MATDGAATVAGASPGSLGQSTLEEDLRLIWVLAGIIAAVLALSIVFIVSGLGRPLIIVGCVVAVGGPALYGRIDLSAAVVVICAMLSPLITVICHSHLGAWVDNVALAVLAGVCLLLALRDRRFALLAWFAFAVLVVGVAVLRAPTHSIGLYQARQILVPVALIFSGIVVARHAPNLNSLRMAVLVTGGLNLIYMAVEAGLGPVIPPHAAYEFKEFSRVHKEIETSSGLPGNYYFFYSSGHNKLVRLGGLLFNPPVTGIFTGLMAIVSFWTIRCRPLALGLAAAGLIATVATFSRAGILLVFLGIGLPLLVGWAGKKIGIGIALVLLAIGTPIVLAQGSSSRHLEGFTSSLEVAFHHPLGIGFGHFGNSAKTFATSHAGESLLGVFIAGGGILALLLILATAVALFRATGKAGWIAWTGIAALVVAGLSESGGGLAGTAGLWLFCGAALGIAAVLTGPPKAPEPGPADSG